MKELGIRVALGAHRMQLMRSALEKPPLLLLTGSTLGMMLGIGASRLLQQIVYEADARDPAVLGGVVATMALLGIVATWVPARRALSVDPSRLMREE
jgi:ABC-type lipoprotein release transport system permease subunit